MEPRVQPSAQVQREAATWFARLRTPSITAAELARFEAWRSEPAHDAAFSALQAIWRSGDGLEDDPEIRTAIQDAVTPEPKRRALRGRVVWGAAGMGLAAVLCLGVVIGTSATFRGETYRTAVGEQRALHLADGSVVRLDTDSQITVREGPRSRELWLARGRAFFDVAHDAARPFLVTASATQVRAVGTRFDVQRLPTAVAVTLVQGVVTVRRQSAFADPPRTLHAGESVVDSANGVTKPHPVDVAAETAWTAGHIVFHDKPLMQAIAEANRYTTVKLRLKDESELGSVHVDGVFNTGDTAALVSALETLYGLRAMPSSNGVILLQRQATLPPAAASEK